MYDSYTKRKYTNTYLVKYYVIKSFQNLIQYLKHLINNT